VGFDVIAVHCKRSHAEFWSNSTVFHRLCGVVLHWLLFWARTYITPYYIRQKVRRRGTSLTNHDHLSMNAFCVPLVQRDRSETWPTCCHYIKSFCWVLPCTQGLCRSMCCAQLCSLPCAAQPSMMHVEGNTELKIAFRLGRPVAVLHSIGKPHDSVQLSGIQYAGVMGNGPSFSILHTSR
jgi:hypothetical protein